MGKFDLPAMIDFILDKMNQTQLHYVGHSQGCTVLFTMLCLLPEYNGKIISMHAMAPAVFLGHTKSVDRNLLQYMDQVKVRQVYCNLFTDMEVMTCFWWNF